jgi:Na+-transporting NADH:ubiquinone oxidoreductase subunit NqrA
MIQKEKDRNCFFDNEQAKAYSNAMQQIARDIKFQSYDDNKISKPEKRFKSHVHFLQPIIITPPPIVFVKVYYQDLLVVDQYYFTGTNSIQASPLD